MTDFPYGAVLKIQREWREQDIFAKMDQMAAIGMNTVVVWPPVFWWEDRSMPDYPFHTGTQILRHAGDLGMRVIIELSGQLTSLEYAPDFVMKDEYLTTGPDGAVARQDWHYGCLNYNHPEVKELIESCFADAARHYQSFSSLYGYDIWNETMFSSFDSFTLTLFQGWLKDKYGTIEELNDAWDRAYSDWSQIRFTNWMWASVMPVVDLNRFRNDNIGSLLREWSAVVKSVDLTHPVIADNIHSMITENGDYNRPHDDWIVAEAVDEFGMSFYPKNVPPFMTPAVRCETFTAVHSATRSGRFWVSEMQTNTQSMFTPQSVVYPWELRQWNLEALSRGAKGIVYWKWDPFSKGLQTSGRGLTDTKGDLTDRAREAEAIKKAIDAFSTEFCDYGPIKPRWAILYDKDNHDFVKALTVNYATYIEDSIYTDSIRGLYECLWKQDIPVKFITAADVIAGEDLDYDVIFSTCQVCVPQALAGKIVEFVKSGGTWISDGRFGFIDERGVMYSDIPAGPLSSQLGWVVKDSDVTDLDITLTTHGNVDGYYKKLCVNTNHCEVTGTFADGAAAVLKTRLGSGSFIQIATYLWYGYSKNPDAGADLLITGLADWLQAKWVTCDNPNIKLSVLTAEAGPQDGALVFAINYSEAGQSATVFLHEPCDTAFQLTDVFTHQTAAINNHFTVQLPGHGSGVYKLEKVWP